MKIKCSIIIIIACLSKFVNFFFAFLFVVSFRFSLTLWEMFNRFLFCVSNWIKLYLLCNVVLFLLHFPPSSKHIFVSVYTSVCYVITVFFNNITSSMHCINVPLRPRNFQFIFRCIIFPRFQSKHFHLLFEWQLFGYGFRITLLLLLLFFSQSSGAWISDGRRKQINIDIWVIIIIVSSVYL